MSLRSSLSRRHLIALAAAACAPGTFAQPLPQHNLLLSWEVVEAGSATRAVGGGGGWTVSTQGMGGTQPGVVLRSQQAASSRGVQQLRVFNGGRAVVRLGEPVQVVWAEGLRTPQGDVGVLRQAWAEAVTELALQPSWPGGAAPVVLGISAVLPQGAPLGGMAPMTTLGQAPLRDSPPAHAQLATQLLLPLGEWTTVADLAPAAAPPAGELSTRAVQRRSGPLLRVRVDRL